MLFLFMGTHYGFSVCVVPLPRDTEELKRRILGAVACFTADLSERVWQETVYKTNVSRVTRATHQVTVKRNFNTKNIKFALEQATKPGGE